MAQPQRRILIIGGGIGGLCLAQGLHRRGIAATVFERDPSQHGRQQGYRLRISPEGEQALRDCLAEREQDLLTATANAHYDRKLAVYDEQLGEQWAPTFGDARGDRPDKVDAVDRRTLRRILLSGIEDQVQFGKRFVRYEELLNGRVIAHFADGTREVGDVLVAADGVNSLVRAQARPHDQPEDLGVRTIFSRIPYTAGDSGLPESLQHRFSYVVGDGGHHLGLMPMAFRTRPAEAARRIAPGLELPDTDDYYMSVFNVQQADLGLDDAELFALTGEQLCALVVERTRDWHPDLHEVFKHAEPAESFAAALRCTLPVQPWSPGPIVPLGDAVHAMPPSGGVGANTAVRDAAGLASALADVESGKRTLKEAVEEYQRAMVDYATAAVVMSLQIADWSFKGIAIPADRYA